MPVAAAGERLDRYLAELADGGSDTLPGLSRSRLQRLIKTGHVRVDDASVRPALSLRGGEIITVELPPPEPIDVVPESMDLDVVFEDGDMVVINKPAGLIVHPGAGHSHGTLVNGLLAHCRDLSGIGGLLRPGIVHRLDRGTSGVLIVAKNDAAHLALARQFAERSVKKRYVAFVHGVPTPASDTIDTFYGRHRRDRRRFTSRIQPATDSGRRAVTRYRVRASGGGVARLEVSLLTGRTHQIRVHLFERGHPVLGDPLYGGARPSKLPKGPVRDHATKLDHQALHAEEIRIDHPSTGAPLRFRAPSPDDLAALSDAIDAESPALPLSSR